MRKGLTSRAAWAGSAAAFALVLGASLPAQTVCTATPELEARVKAQPDSQTYATLGNWFADQKQFDCAASAFATASGLEPTSAPLAYLWGLSLHSAGHDVQALAPLNQARQLDAADIRPRLALAAALGQLKKTAEAEAEWRAALAVDPDSAPALDGLSQSLIDHSDFRAVIALLDKPGSSRVRTPQQSLNLGVAYAGMAELNDAVRVLREGLNNDPGSLPIADELSMVLMLQSRQDDAFAVLEMALAKHPDDRTTQLLYLRTLVSTQSPKAAAYAHKLLAAYPAQWEVQYLNGVLASREGDLSTARVCLERSIALNPAYVESQAALGNVLAKAGDYAAARQHLENAIAMGDDQPEVQYDLAMVLKHQGDTAAAQAKLALYQMLKEAQSDKTQAAGKAEEGDQAMDAGDAARAASLYREAQAADPDEPLLAYKLSKALDELKDVAGEKAALQRAIQLNPNLAEAENQMGFLVVREGDAAHAEGYFRTAVRAAPSYVVAWINLGATLASEAKWQDARQALARALEVDPDNAEARRLSQAIADANPAP